MIKEIDHIGVAVKSIDSSLAFYKAMGIEPSHIEEVPSQKVKVAFLTVGGTHIELLEPTTPDSPVAKHLEKRGEGMHHIAYRVNDINASIKSLMDSGIEMINKTPVDGAHEMWVAFAHPKSTSGVLTEICQPKKG